MLRFAVLLATVTCACSGKGQFSGGAPVATPTPLQFSSPPSGTSWAAAVPRELPPVDVAGMQLVADCPIVDKKENSKTRLECAIQAKGEPLFDVPIKQFLAETKSGTTESISAFTKERNAANHEVTVLEIPLEQFASYKAIRPVIDEKGWDAPEVVQAIKGVEVTDALVAQALRNDKEYVQAIVGEDLLSDDCDVGLARTAAGTWFCMRPEDPTLWIGGGIPQVLPCQGDLVFRVGAPGENQCAAASLAAFVAEETECPNSKPESGPFIVFTSSETCVRFARRSHR